MRITLLVDDLAPLGTPVHGFSALVEGLSGRILFDTGPDGEVLLAALGGLDLGVDDLDLVVVSHSHRDHTGGLARVLYERPRLPVSVPLGGSSKVAMMLPRETVLVGEDRPRPLAPWISTTGDLGGDIPEQALLLETDEGVVVLTGCGHPGLERLVDAAGGRARMVIGGIHDLTEETLSRSRVGALVACHCTPGKQVLAHRFPSVSLGRAGDAFELEGPELTGPTART